MKKFMSKVKRNKENGEQPAGTATTGAPMVAPQGDSPEAIVVREVIAFCESAAPGANGAGEEYLHLPAIVDGAESSPTAAKEAAVTIRKYLSSDQYNRGFAQYNAIMLMRILTDNPGRNFTQNLDKDFIHTIKKLLRDSPDHGVQQILRETLDYFEVERAPTNATLGTLMEMWRREKGLGAQLYARNNSARGGVMVPGGGGAPHHSRRTRSLPPPAELAARIEEAKTTSRLLLQTMQSTPNSELSQNELVKEFATRARAAQKSIQSYMHADNPGPDDDTMLTLIETNEQLNIAMSKHHRALLSAKKAASTTASPQPQSPPLQAGNPPPNLNAYGQVTAQSRTNGYGQVNGQNSFVPPPGPPPSQQPANFARSADAPDNPFTDAAEYEQEQDKPKSSFSLFGRSQKPAPAPATDNQAYQPYSPPNPAPPMSAVSDISDGPTRPTGHGFGQESTQSYLNRQESATNHLTMHGGSPPPQQDR